MEAPLSPSEAAALLGVGRSQVHRLLQSGALRGRRLGRSWMVDAESVRQRRAVRPGRGRPPSAGLAWQVISSAAVADVDDLPPLAVGARRRSAVHRCRVLPADLDLLVDDGRVVVSGAGGAAALGAAVPGRDERDLYVRAADWPSLAADHHVREGDVEANVIVRVVADDVWPFAEGERIAPAVVCALDAYERLDLRSAHEALAVEAQP